MVRYNYMIPELSSYPVAQNSQLRIPRQQKPAIKRILVVRQESEFRLNLRILQDYMRIV